VAIHLPRRGLPDVQQGIAPAPLQRPSMDLSNFGGGQAVENAFNQSRALAGDTADIIFKEEMRAQEAQLNDLDTQLGGLEGKSRDAILAAKGAAAAEAQTKTLQDFDKQASEVLKGATSERVKERLRNSIEKRRIALEGTTNGHVRGQLLQYEEEKARSKVALERDNAIKSMDPLRVAMALDEQHSTLRTYAALSGKPKDWLDAELAKETSTIHQGVINQYLASGQDKAANDYFAKHKDEILGSVQPSIKADLEAGSYLAESQREEDRIASSGKSEEEMYAEARKIKDSKLRDLVERRLDQRISRDKRAAEATYAKNLDGFVKRVSEKWVPNNVSSAYTVEDVVGWDSWNKLESRDQKALKKLFDVVNGKEAAETDNLAFTKLNAMSKAELASLTSEQLYLKFRPSFTDEHYRQYVVPAWNAARDKSGEKFNSLISDNDTILSALASVGVGGIVKGDTLAAISGEKADPVKAETFKLFKFAIDAKREAYHAKTGKNPDDKWMREEAERLALEWGRDIFLDRGWAGMGESRKKVYTTYKFGDLVRDQKIVERVKTGPLVIHHETRQDFFRYAQSIPGLLPRGMSQQEFEANHRERINTAYLAKLAGADDATVAKILEGK